MRYYIFSNEEKAPETLRILLNGLIIGWPTDDPIINRTNQSYTGKKIGEFCIRKAKML